MAQEDTSQTNLPPGVIPANSQFVAERISVPQLDPEIENELIDSLVEQNSRVRHQAVTAEEAERVRVTENKSTNERIVQAVKDAEKANELDYLGKTERAKRQDEALKSIEQQNGAEVMNSILGNEVLDAAKDMQEAARQYDNFMETREEVSPLNIIGAFFDRSKHNTLARNFNRAEERFLSLQNALSQAATVSSAQARSVRELQPTAPNQKEQDAFRLGNTAKSVEAQAAAAEKFSNLKAEAEARILEFRRGSVGAIANFFDTFSRIQASNTAGVDAELRQRQLAQMDTALAEAVMRPEQTAFILSNTPITADKLATMNVQQRVAALKIAAGQPIVLNLADQAEVQNAAAVVDTAHPNPYIKYIFKQIAPVVNQDASMAQQSGAAFDMLPEDKKVAARKEGARKQKEFETFFDTRPVEFIDATGKKEVKTTTQWVGDRLFQDPAGSGLIAYTNDYAESYIKSNRPGAKVIQTIRTNIAGGSLRPGQLIDAEYWRQASGNNAEAMYDAYRFMQEQVAINTPWREFGLKAPAGYFEITYGARTLSWLPYKQKTVRINSIEDVTNMFIQMDNVKKAEGYYKNSQQVGAPVSPFPSKEEMKENFKGGVTKTGDLLFGDELPSGENKQKGKE